MVLARRLQQRIGVTDLRDHLECGVNEEPCDPLADER
jgi:hypothetical protein